MLKRLILSLARHAPPNICISSLDFSYESNSESKFVLDLTKNDQIFLKSKSQTSANLMTTKVKI